MADQQTPSNGNMRTFVIIWVGQLFSLLGTAMTQFGITIWAWQETERATALALVGFCGFLPVVLLSPLAGALVDRWNRKLVMMLSDIAAGMGTILLLILYATGHLQIWHLCVITAFEGAFGAFQFPAYSAAISLIIPKEQYGRASGMLSLAHSASGILAPVAAAALLARLGLTSIFAIDVATLILAVSILFFVHIPQPTLTPEEAARPRNSLLEDTLFGFHYVWEHRSLLWLQMTFFAINLIAVFGMTVLNPMILARTGNDEMILGSVQSAGAIGGLIGGLILSAWGGPKRRIYGVLGGMVLISLLGTLPMGLGRTVFVWSAAQFLILFILPILNGSNQAIWQSKVPPALQGRVFSVRLLIAQITAPLGMLLAGPLADYVFEPAMRAGGSLAPTFGWLVGTGPGAGMALMIVISGILGTFVGIIAYFFPLIRHVETLLPDHDVVVPAADTLNATEA